MSSALSTNATDAPQVTDDDNSADALQDEIASLEQKLQAAKLRLHRQTPRSSTPELAPSPAPSHLHFLLLLSDSALPLGSFAYSSGLESFLAHHPRCPAPAAQLAHFLALSLHSLTSTTLPYVVAGHRCPTQLSDLDNDLDASTPCTVARRASVKQGLALLAVWERSFRAQHQHRRGQGQTSAGEHGHADEAAKALATFSASLKLAAQKQHGAETPSIFNPNGHLPPLFGALCLALSIPLPQTLYLYFLNHAKTVISAAIRAGVLGPYQAQGILAGEDLRGKIWGIVERAISVLNGPPGISDEILESTINGPAAGVKDGNRREGAWSAAKLATSLAGQSVPVLDLWGGRHEIIYSRIFNS